MVVDGLSTKWKWTRPWSRKCRRRLVMLGLIVRATWRSPSSDPWVRAGGRDRGHQAEVFEMASNASSSDSWWQGQTWSSDSWGGSSGEGRANWVYVSHSGNRGWGSSDPWHWWHRDDDRGDRGVPQGGREGGADLRERDAADHPHSVESDGDDHGKGDLPSGRVMCVHEKQDKEEEKRSMGKLSSSYPPVFKAKQGEATVTGKELSSFGCVAKDINFLITLSVLE